MNLVKKIQENIFRHELFPRGARIVVGVSGGPDSVCLLEILHKLKDKYNLKLIVAHVNYGLRGKDSQRDEEFVKKMAKKYNLKLEVLKSRIIKSPKNRKTLSENKLRDIRYQFFEKVRNKYRANRIAVAHNRDDQAETVLMRILRGSGLRGLGAIRFSPSPSLPARFAARRAGKAELRRASKHNNIIRPLLNIPRKEILAYLRKHKIPHRTDKTNLGTDFTRNKIRNKLIPYLEKDFNPNIQETLYKLSQSVADDYEFINKFSSAWSEANETLRASELTKLHPAVRKEALRLAIEKHVPGLREIESAHVDEILKILKSSKSKRQILKLKGLKISRVGDKLIIRKQ